MKKTLLAIALLATVATAAPAPYPITINSRNQTAPNVVVYQGNEMSFRASFTDGSTASDITGATPFMNWATNSLASGMSTSSWQVVGATTGLVDFTFSPQALNFTPGRYMYEVGLINDDVPSVYRQGVFQINGSPQGSGAASVVFVDDVNWSLIGNYYNTSTDGPYLFVSGFTYTTNATGQLLLTAAITETQDLQAVTENGGTTTEKVTIDAANAHTNTYGGMLGIGAVRWQDSGGQAIANASHADSLGQAYGVSSHADSGGITHGVQSHASGNGAIAQHDQSWVAVDGTTTLSTTNKQATLHFDNGIRLLGAAGVEIEGTNTAAAFIGDGSGLTGIDASPWTDNGDDTITYNGDGFNMTNAANGDVFSVGVDGKVLTDCCVEIGTTPVFASSRALKIYDDGVQFAARISLIGTGDSGFPAIEFVTDGTGAKRTLIRHEGEGSGDYGISIWTSDGGALAERVRFAGSGNTGFGTDAPATKAHVNGAITQTELSADPADPAEGDSVQWQSDGTGSGDDGDIMVKITAGGVTKTITLIDFSAF